MPKAGAKVHLIPTNTKYSQRFFPGIIKIFYKYADNKSVIRTRKLAGKREGERWTHYYIIYKGERQKKGKEKIRKTGKC